MIKLQTHTLMCSALQRHFDRNVGSDGSSPEATEWLLCQLEIKISHLDPINTWSLPDAALPSLLCVFLGVNVFAKVCLHLAHTRHVWQIFSHQHWLWEFLWAQQQGFILNLYWTILDIFVWSLLKPLWLFEMREANYKLLIQLLVTLPYQSILLIC